MADFDAWRGLLGEDVIVTLDHPAEGREQVVARGRLLAIDDGGEARLMDEMGFVHYCWPALNVAKVSVGVGHSQTDRAPTDVTQSVTVDRTDLYLSLLTVWPPEWDEPRREAIGRLRALYGPDDFGGPQEIIQTVDWPESRG